MGLPDGLMRINRVACRIIGLPKRAKVEEGGSIIVRATGIVRRIDELGRVVIPKEIRRTLRIREGDPLQTTSTVSSTERGYLALCGLANLLNQR